MKHVTRQQISHRGGGMEIDVYKHLGKGYEGVLMSAYQNYLGGGMLGSIQNDCNRNGWTSDAKLVKLADKLARHFHKLTCHDECEYESATFEENQMRPSSAY